MISDISSSSNTNTYNSNSNILVLNPNKLSQELLTPECLNFLLSLHEQFEPIRESLLYQRKRTNELRSHGLEGFHYPPETEKIRNGDWKITSVPPQLEKRWVEIATSPDQETRCINAMNSGANVWMCDFEDGMAPSWNNILKGQLNLIKINQRKLKFSKKGKEYTINSDSNVAILVRPRGWHMVEKNLIINGKPISASIFDFGVYFFHNVHIRKLNNFGGCFYYLCKLESYLEARLWNDIFVKSQEFMGEPVGTIKSTVIIETLGASLDMEEILYELRDHITCLNVGRWDYVFSVIKSMNKNKDVILPDKEQITMSVPFLKAYIDKIVHVAHKRGAHAIGGMSSYLPSETDKEANEKALKKIYEDKTREAQTGCDGGWISHPALLNLCIDVLNKRLGGKVHQKDFLREDVNVTAQDLVNLKIANGFITEKGIRKNFSACVEYFYYWFQGFGAVRVDNTMCGLATVEISRTQIWQWIYHHAHTKDGKLIDEKFYNQMRTEEVNNLRKTLKDEFLLEKAVKVIDDLCLAKEFVEFASLPAYDVLLNLPKPNL